MCSIITIDNGTLKPGKLEKYLERETMFNDDGMVIQIQDSHGRMSSLKTFEVDSAMAFLNSNSWVRMWMHMRAATQGAVNLRNIHGWLTNDSTAVMHNGILSDKDSKAFNVDSELIVHWLETLGLSYTLEMLLGEHFANVFIIKNTGDYVVSRTGGGSLFTDGEGNFSTNAVGNINKRVRHKYQKVFLSDFVARDIKRLIKTDVNSVGTLLDFEDKSYLDEKYKNSSNYLMDKYDREYHDYKTKYDNAMHSDDDSGRFNDTGDLNGVNPNAEKIADANDLEEEIADEEFNRKRDELTARWDQVIDREAFSDEEYREYLDEGRLVEFEQAKLKRGG